MTPLPGDSGREQTGRREVVDLRKGFVSRQAVSTNVMSKPHTVATRCRRGVRVQFASNSVGRR
jgi:hypothetical protein